MATRMKQRRGTHDQWLSTNAGQGPILESGEIGYETDTNKFKIGDGTNHWNALPYFLDEDSLGGSLGDYVLTSTKGQVNGVASLDADGQVPISQLGNIIDAAPAALDTLNELAAALGDDQNFAANLTTTLGNKQDKVTGVSDTEIGYLDGVTSSIQTQINSKLDSANLTEAAQDAVNTALVAGTGLDKTYNDSSNTITLDIDSTVATKTYADDAVSTHSSDTTSVHGITDTAELATKTFAAELLTNATKTNVTITGDKNGLIITAENGVADSTTDNLTEGSTNKYFTDERAQDAVGNSVGTGLSYDDASGAISVNTSAIQAVVSGVSDTEIGYLDGVTSAIQTQLDAKLPKSGGTMTGALTLSGAPTADLHAATKLYVDNVTAGINFHESVHAASVNNLAANYSNGTSGVGATLTANTNRAFNTLDGESVVVGQRVLIKNQTDEKQNGIYKLTTNGSGSTPWVLTRATDADNNPVGEMKTGDFCFVQNGATNASLGFINNSTANPIVIGTDNITYTEFNAAKTIVTGNGLTEATPGVISIDTAITQTRVSGVSDTEIGYLDGVTSAIQNQIDDKAPSDSPTFTGTVDFTGATLTGIPVTEAATPTAQGVVYAQTDETNTLLGLNSSATREGTLATDATGVGEDALASGNASTALGNGAWARGANSTALGRYTQVDHNASIALGADANTNGANQISIGGSVESGNQITRFRVRGMGIDWTSNPVPAVNTAGPELFASTAFSNASDEIYYQNGILYIGVISGGTPDATTFNNAYPVGSVVTISEYGVADTVFTVPSAATWNGYYEIEIPVTLTSGSGNYGSNWVMTGKVPTESGKYLTNDGTSTSWSNLPVNLENPNLENGLSSAFFIGTYNSNLIITSTDNASTWQNNSVSGAQNPNWAAFAYGNGKNVAVTNNSLGDPTKIYYSTDGTDWTLASTFSSSIQFQSVAYGNGKFVAISSGDTGAVSTDGVAWTTMTMPSGNSWTKVVFGGDKFVAISSANFAYSTDGINWTSVTPPNTSYSWYYGAYENGKFVVANYSGNDYVLLSTDGINWYESDPITSLNGEYVNNIASGDGKFVIIAGYNTNTWTSTDGNSWTLNSGVLPNSGNQWTYITSDGTKFFLATPYGNRATSPDGISWTAGSSYYGNFINSIGSGFAPASGTLSVAGNAGTNGQLLQSTGTGVKWVSAIPSQTGNSGKYLSTNGTSTSWANNGKTLLYSLPAYYIVGNPYTLDTTALSGYKDIEIAFNGIVGNANNYAEITLNSTNGSVTHWNCSNDGINPFQPVSGAGFGAASHPLGYGNFPYYSIRPEANSVWSANATLFEFNSYAKSLLMTSKMFYQTYNYRVTENTTSNTVFNNFSYLTGITISLSGATEYSEGTINIYGIN